jgi:hypothetical protein
MTGPAPRTALAALCLFAVRGVGLLGAALFTFVREVRIALNEFDHDP